MPKAELLATGGARISAGALQDLIPEAERDGRRPWSLEHSGHSCGNPLQDSMLPLSRWKADSLAALPFAGLLALEDEFWLHLNGGWEQVKGGEKQQEK
jgi:hypothetical protein